MRKFLLLLAPLVLGFGVMTGFMAVVTIGDGSVSKPFQIWAMVLVCGGLGLGLVGWLMPPQKQRRER